MGMAAQRTTAYADSAKNLCLIPHTDLTQFYTCLKNRGQILYKLTEVNTPICCKIKKDFIIIKGILRINEFHLKIMFGNLFKAYLKRCLFFFFILHLNLIILRRSHTNDLLKRLNDLVIFYFPRACQNKTILDAPGCFHNNMLADFDIKIKRIKIINLTCLTKSNANYFYHFTNSPSLRAASSPWSHRNLHSQPDVPLPAPAIV